jgi:hypothetical protein
VAAPKAISRTATIRATHGNTRQPRWLPSSSVGSTLGQPARLNDLTRPAASATTRRTRRPSTASDLTVSARKLLAREVPDCSNPARTGRLEPVPPTPGPRSGGSRVRRAARASSATAAPVRESHDSVGLPIHL